MSQAMKDAIEACSVCNDPEGWRGGSHYHCAECGKVTGMYGHYSKGKFICKTTKDA